MDKVNALFSVKGQTALVTGGATGLGLACTRALLQAGARVVIASRKAEQCRAVAESLVAEGYDCIGIEGDVSSQGGVDKLLTAVEKNTDELHILVNNAGATWGAPYEAFPWSAWEKVLNVNVTGLFSLTRSLTPLLERSAAHGAPSRVVNIGSMVGTIALADNAYSYSVSKAAVHHLTRILAGELGPRGITVNAIAPGTFNTKMTSHALGDAHGQHETAKSIPLRRIGEEADLMGAILYLCGRAGSYVNGAIIPVDGGISVQTREHMFAN